MAGTRQAPGRVFFPLGVLQKIESGRPGYRVKKLQNQPLKTLFAPIPEFILRNLRVFSSVVFFVLFSYLDDTACLFAAFVCPAFFFLCPLLSALYLILRTYTK